MRRSTRQAGAHRTVPVKRDAIRPPAGVFRPRVSSCGWKHRLQTYSLAAMLICTLHAAGCSCAQDLDSRIRIAGVWGEAGQGPGQFQAPEGIAVDPGGNIYICDTGNNRIQKFDADRRFISSLGAFGWQKETFDTPVAVEARNGLDVFIADQNNQRIERYDRELNYLSTLASQDDWDPRFQFGFPRDMALSSQGELFCLDGENNRILKLDVLGQPQLSFGDYDAGEGRLLHPRRLLVSDRGLVFVTDDAAGRVTVFDEHGNYLYAIGEGLLKGPVGLTQMEPGMLLVADHAGTALFIFKETGDLVLRLPLDAANRPSEPIDVACWKSQIYLLDRAWARVLILDWVDSEGLNYP